MKLNTNRFALYEFKNQIWTVTAEEGTTVEDILKPEYFGNVANRLQQYDKICVRIDTGEFYMELLVVACGKNWAKTIVMGNAEFSESVNYDGAREEVFEAYSVVFKGPHNKWSVLRKADNEVLKNEFESKAQAQTWLSSYLMAL